MRLLVDIGGTNARFARADPEGAISCHRSYAVAEFADFESALARYAADTGGLQPCRSAAVGAAGPVLDGHVRLTNAPWELSETGLSRLAGDVPVRLVNDLEAVALGLPHLAPADVTPVGEGPARPHPGRRMLALNVGTGFGAASVGLAGGEWLPGPSEAGHMSFGAQTMEEMALLGVDGVAGGTVEDVLSGPGLLGLYRKQCHRLGVTPTACGAEEVFAQVPADAAASEALRLFTGWLGRVAGDLALATAAWGGVFLTGGVVHGWSGRAPRGLFRSGFEAKGKMQARMRETFTGVITREDVALLGLSRASMPGRAPGGRFPVEK